MLLARSEAVTERKTSLPFSRSSPTAVALFPWSEHMLDIATPVSGCSPALCICLLMHWLTAAVQIGVPGDRPASSGTDRSRLCRHGAGERHPTPGAEG